MVKKIILIVVILIAVPLIAAIFIPRGMTVEREIQVNKPLGEVYDYLRHLKNQEFYSKWAMMDPHMKRIYTGTDGTEGFISAWAGDESGAGEQEIVKLRKNRRIDVVLRFKNPLESEATSWFKTIAKDSLSTVVKWHFEGEVVYPVNFIRLFVDVEDMLGKDLEFGLNNLKRILETKQPVALL